VTSSFTLFDEVVVRAARPEWSYEPTSGAGAQRHGGRFNARGTPALYTSLDFNTCAREVRFSLNVSPYTFYHLRVISRRILDLRKQDVLEALGFTEQDLACSNWESEMHRGLDPQSNRLAAKLIAMGAHGILVPSFAPGNAGVGSNLVLWRWNDSPAEANDGTAKVRVLNRSGLPKDRSSWES
jgi:RES domain-containing protein